MCKSYSLQKVNALKNADTVFRDIEQEMARGLALAQYVAHFLAQYVAHLQLEKDVDEVLSSKLCERGKAAPCKE